MKFVFSASLLTLLLSLSFTVTNSFKSDQKEHHRVKDAYEEKGDKVSSMLQKAEIETDQLRLYIRAFKQEEKIEIWAKNNLDEKYQLLIEYDVCRSSGALGPKRKQGDFQVPEGFYHIDRFNPVSNYHLSLGINYPNKSDKILGTSSKLGGDIFIHGNCVTIGCLPMTDDKIKEIYILCVEARNNGQKTIPVTIFPAKLTDNKWSELSSDYADEKEMISLWKDLKEGFDYFDSNKYLPNISFLDNGRQALI